MGCAHVKLGILLRGFEDEDGEVSETRCVRASDLYAFRDRGGLNDECQLMQLRIRGRKAIV